MRAGYHGRGPLAPARLFAMAATLVMALGACATTKAPAPVTATDRPPTADGPPTGAEPDVDVDSEARPTKLVAGNFVSQSRGVEGGIVLLYPRIIPSADAAAHRGTALALQEKIRGLLVSTFPGRPIDVRPEGERVCIKTGCIAASVGVLIVTRDTHCVAVVSLTAPGVAEHTLHPWAGDVVAAPSVPFREPLESHVRVKDMVPCAELSDTPPERVNTLRQALESLR